MQFRLILGKQGQVMSKDHLKGAAKKVEGTIKEAAGKLSGDRSLKLKGKAAKAEGQIRLIAADAKDRLKASGRKR
jgi:uncharacterized protein YjbJ (UPF0337 family)